MKKRITIDSGFNTSFHSEKGLSADTATISSEEEQWSITGSVEGEDKEVCDITVIFGGKTWKGTIQDFFAIQAIAKNALFEMEVVALSGEDFTATQCKEELESLLSHFK